MNIQRQFYNTLKLVIFFAILAQTSYVFAQIPSFTRIDTGSLSNDNIRGRGLYVVDYNLDGLLDLYVGNSTGVGGLNRPNLLFTNKGEGYFKLYEDGLLSSKIYKHNSGSNWGDLDNDGDPDLYNDGQIFLNDGTGKFVKGQQVTERNEVNAIWIDLNNDSYLDLLTNVYFGANYAYLSQGDGTFLETEAGDFAKKGVGASQSFSMADIDNDGDMDVLEANICFAGACDTLIPNTMYINNEGNLMALGAEYALVSEAMETPGSSWGDYDNDGDMDVYVLSFQDRGDVLYRNDGNYMFTPIVLDPEHTGNKWPYNSSWGDLNNDGFLDLFVSIIPDGNVVHKECTWFNNMLYLNKGDGTFLRLPYGDIINDGGEPHVMNDFDNDGDLDIIIGHGNINPYIKNIFVYLNEGNKNHWLNISCEGTRSNRSAIGARVRVKAIIEGETVWMTREISQENGVHACNGPRLHFGLGDAEKADSVIIRWPSGILDVYTDIQANSFYKAVEEVRLSRDKRIQK